MTCRQCWNIGNWTLRNKLLKIFNRNPNILFKTMRLKLSSGKCRPFCLGLHVLNRGFGATCRQLSTTLKVGMTGFKNSSHGPFQMFNSRLLPHHQLRWPINLITNQLKDAVFSIIFSERKIWYYDNLNNWNLYTSVNPNLNFNVYFLDVAFLYNERDKQKCITDSMYTFLLPAKQNALLLTKWYSVSTHDGSFKYMCLVFQANNAFCAPDMM